MAKGEPTVGYKFYTFLVDTKRFCGAILADINMDWRGKTCNEIGTCKCRVKLLSMDGVGRGMEVDFIVQFELVSVDALVMRSFSCCKRCGVGFFSRLVCFFHPKK